MTIEMLLATAILAVAKPAAEACQPSTARVVGKLADIARNRLDKRVPVSGLGEASSLWALGMPHGLDRELLIEQGRISSGGFEDHRYAVDELADTEAVFLIYANVYRWSAQPLPGSVRTFADLEAHIGKMVAERGSSTDQPVAFRLIGKAKSLRWFVVGGMGNLSPNPRASFDRARTQGGLDDVSIEALGFYSRCHRGLATNPRSEVHIHFRTTSGSPFVAHLDDEIDIEPGATLLLPTG